MKIYKLKRTSLLRIAVLATGLAAAIMVATMSPQVAHAFPNKAQNCANCHVGSTSGATTATPSTTTPVAGATFTVAITLAANPTGGNSGYAIIPVTAGTGTTNAGNTGPVLSYTATMTAPASAGTYSYMVYTNQGSRATGQTGSATYTIIVAAGSTTPPVTTTSTPPVTTTTTPPVTTTTTPPVTTTSTPPVTTTSTPPVTTTTTPPVVGPANIHGPYVINAPQCAFCHRAHAAKAPNLLVAGSQSAMCFTCHNGSGANANVALQYSLTRPANDPAARVYYSHDALAPSTHTLSSQDEFGVVTNGVVINRHSQCADCHNSHRATAKTTRDGVSTVTGWEASGRLEGVSGVKVVNGAAGAAPSYTFLSGVDTNVVPANAVTREYQLCFKCHSGFTTQLPNIAGKPSRDRLDKGVELNPNNPSYHPIEAPGKNTSAAMIASLSGYSPYRQWTFRIGDTIRCSNCHASSTKYNQTTPPAAGSSLPSHTSQVAGILLAPYRNRVLKPVGEAYNAAEFTLCFMCHATGPFDGTNSSATNWTKHNGHTNTRRGTNTGGQDIDSPSANGGNAICSECHYRIHSATYKVGTQSITSARGMVNFSPNVVGAGATWNGSGCSNFTCHGKSH